jgi:tRNA A-37 threonylcarbamoyl transferase component Bud32
MNSLKEKVEDKIKRFKKTDQNKLIWISEDWNNKGFQNFIEQFDRTPPAGIVVNDGRNDLIRINQFSRNDLMVKKFNLQRTYDKLRFCLLDSKAIRSLRIALALEEIGVKTPKPVAVVEQRGKFNQLLYSYYITEYVDYDYNLLDIVADKDHPRRDEVKSLIPVIGKDVKKMHKAGIIHNDLHAGNILVTDSNDRPEFYYIDLNRGRIKSELSTKQRMNDLARFKLTTLEQEIFMKEYAPKSYQQLLELMIEQRKKRKKFLNLKRGFRSKIRSLWG